MKSAIRILLLSSILWPIQNWASCDYQQQVHQNLVASLFSTLSFGCTLNVTPLEKPDLLYREFYFDERGLFLTLISRPGDFEHSVATQSYFLFPLRQNPSFEFFDQNATLAVRASNGQIFSFSTNTVQLGSIAGEVWSLPIQPELGSENFPRPQKLAGLILDAGWKIGDRAYKDRQGRSRWIDENGFECEVGNEEIFDYDHVLYGEPVFYRTTTQQWREYLAHRCPRISLKSLVSEDTN